MTASLFCQLFKPATWVVFLWVVLSLDGHLTGNLTKFNKQNANSFKSLYPDLEEGQQCLWLPSFKPLPRLLQHSPLTTSCLYFSASSLLSQYPESLSVDLYWVGTTWKANGLYKTCSICSHWDMWPKVPNMVWYSDPVSLWHRSFNLAPHCLFHQGMD